MPIAKPLDEKELEKALCRLIDSGEDGLRNLVITTPHGPRTLLDLVGHHRPQFAEKTILEDTSDWNGCRGLSKDLFHLITPDIVLRSPLSSENRIIIEVKRTSSFTHVEAEASQVLRYFLHLLATTNKNENLKGQKDIQRAILLAAPISWFSDKKVASPWDYFLKQYGALAKQWNIEIGSIVLDSLI